jgi:hypothetical protein
LFTVNAETPVSYFPLPTPGMMSPNVLCWKSACSPSRAATALNRSMSKPTMVLPSELRNSAGA